MLDGWRITKSRQACSACGREFGESHEFFSGLFERDDGFERRDFCSDCWDDRRAGAEGAGPAPQPFCFWRTRRPPAQEKQTVDTELMWEFFDRLARADTDSKRTLRFVLALYLMRRKELNLLGVERIADGETLMFQRRASAQKVAVANPGLTEEQIRETAGQLTQLLNASL